MPIARSTYRPNRWWQRHKHLSTMVPAVLRRLEPVVYSRTTLELDDGDFLDLDWVKSKSETDRLLIALHGLEGSSVSYYAQGVGKHFSEAGWDVLVTNHRGCSGRINRLLRMYHMGATDDVGRLVKHGVELGYKKIGIVGFSLGGNLCLKYLGEEGHRVPAEVVGGVAFSVPCHIASANRKIDKPHNRIYLLRFLRSLNNKVRLKHRDYPDRIALPTGQNGDKWPSSFAEFDDRFTGPIHGFAGAEDYWEKSSSRQFIPGIKVPALLVNAQNDTFLSQECFPFDEARAMENFWLETPEKGGHVGFGGPKGEAYWSEQRALQFFEQTVGLGTTYPAPKSKAYL
ncbi:MAG: alpha/beta fold hydrolase [Bacteroidota bacterium]